VTSPDRRVDSISVTTLTHWWDHHLPRLEVYGTWQQLHQALTGDGDVGYGLDELARALELAGRVLR
jgi:hypothetical protein